RTQRSTCGTSPPTKGTTRRRGSTSTFRRRPRRSERRSRNKALKRLERRDELARVRIARDSERLVDVVARLRLLLTRERDAREHGEDPRALAIGRLREIERLAQEAFRVGVRFDLGERLGELAQEEDDRGEPTVHFAAREIGARKLH